MDQPQQNQYIPSPAPVNPPPVQQPMAPAPSPEPRKKRFNKDVLFIALAILAVVITASLLAANAANVNVLSYFKIGGMSSDAVAKKAVDYINSNGLAGPGQTATLEGVSVESGLIKMSVKIGENKFDSYVTKDGKLLFPSAIPLGEALSNPTDTNQPTAQTPDSSKVKTEGEAYLGNVAAPLVVAFWSDYQCPYCQKAEQEVLPQIIKDYVNTGKVRLVFKEYAFLGADSQTLAKFSRAVWNAVPAKYYTWHKAMYDNQGQENSGWATEAKIMEITTKAIGVTDANKSLVLFKANNAQYQQEIDASKAEGVNFGITGTPGTIIGKKYISGADTYANFKAAIDAELAGK